MSNYVMLGGHEYVCSGYRSVCVAKYKHGTVKQALWRLLSYFGVKSDHMELSFS